MRVQVLCSLALNAFVSCAALAAAQQQKYDLDVVTSNGRITGHVAPGMRKTAEFLGIPYAQPPVGEFRFAKPLPPKGKTDYVALDWV